MDNKINPRINELIEDFCVYHSDERNHSEITVKYYRRTLIRVFKIIEKEILENEESYEITDITKAHLRKVSRLLKDKGKSAETRNTIINVIKSFYKYLAREEIIPANISIHLPKIKTGKKRSLPPDKEDYEFVIEFVKKKPDSDFRYAGGKENLLFFLRLHFFVMARICEMPTLKVKDIDTKHNTVLIREGKGNKDRIVIIPSEVSQMVNNYIEELNLNKEDYLIRSRSGKKMSERGLSKRLRELLKEIKEKTGRDILWMTAHKLLRQCPATEMRRQGADLVNIQKMLGHTDLNTTKLYVGDDINKMIKQYSNHHPLSSAFK
ncbi:MAG: tyrosine-type recombinase/integrase [Promethearchaeota archaeon]